MNTTLGMSSTVNNGSNSNSNAAELFNPDTVNLTKAKRNHGELMELLDNLSGKLSHVSSTVDKEFLSAYRVHMLTVQAELKSLKNDVSKGEQMLNSDAQVAKLEKESKWFSDECARLKQHFEAMTKDSKQMRQRLLDMAEQRNFLCDQLKALLKRNKVLEAEIQQLKNGGDLQSLSISMGSASFFRAHQNQRGGYHDDHSHGSSRHGAKVAAKHSQGAKQHQPPQQSTRTLPRQGYQGGADTNTNSSSKVRFDPASTVPSRKGTAEDADDDDEVDPMAFLDEEDEDDELAYLQQQLRMQQLRQTRQESARRLSVSLDADQDEDDGDEKSSPAYSRHSSSNRLQLPPPLQRAMASGRGDSLFNIRPASSSGPNSASPPRSLRGSQSAVGLGAGRQSQPTRSASPPLGGGMRNGAAHAMAQSMPALPSISAVNAAGHVSKGKNQTIQQQQQQHQPSPQELQQRYEQSYKSELENLEGQRPRLEVALEESIREIFTEVRNRKKNGSLLCSTKRPTGVAFSGGAASPMGKSSSKNPWATNNVRELPRGMQEVVQELDAQDQAIDPEPGSDGARLIKMTPTITQRGGIAGLGTAQFSENDRFAAMVKYLAQPDVFEEVSKRLWTVFFPPTEEELRASGQYLGKRRGTSSAGGRTTRSPSASRAHSPSAR